MRKKDPAVAGSMFKFFLITLGNSEILFKESIEYGIIFDEYIHYLNLKLQSELKISKY